MKKGHLSHSDREKLRQYEKKIESSYVKVNEFSNAYDDTKEQFDKTMELLDRKRNERELMSGQHIISKDYQKEEKRKVEKAMKFLIKRKLRLSKELKDYEQKKDMAEYRGFEFLGNYVDLVSGGRQSLVPDDKTYIHKTGEKKRYDKVLEKKVLPASITIGGIVLSLIFLSPNITGNVISNLTNQTSNIIGGTLFVIGIIGSYFWFKKKN